MNWRISWSLWYRQVSYWHKWYFRQYVIPLMPLQNLYCNFSNNEKEVKITVKVSYSSIHSCSAIKCTCPISLWIIFLIILASLGIFASLQLSKNWLHSTHGHSLFPILQSEWSLRERRKNFARQNRPLASHQQVNAHVTAAVLVA